MFKWLYKFAAGCEHFVWFPHMKKKHVHTHTHTRTRTDEHATAIFPVAAPTAGALLLVAVIVDAIAVVELQSVTL